MRRGVQRSIPQPTAVSLPASSSRIGHLQCWQEDGSAPVLLESEEEKGVLQVDPFSGQVLRVYIGEEAADPRPSSLILMRGVGCLFGFPNKN